jgi:hypothetical protein
MCTFDRESEQATGIRVQIVVREIDFTLSELVIGEQSLQERVCR